MGTPRRGAGSWPTTTPLWLILSARRSMLRRGSRRLAVYVRRSYKLGFWAMLRCPLKRPNHRLPPPAARGAVVASYGSVALANPPRSNASTVCTLPRSEAPPGCTPSDPTGAEVAASPANGDSAELPPSGSRRRPSSLVHASRLVHAMLEEEAERFEVMSTAAGVADVRSMLVKVYDCSRSDTPPSESAGISNWGAARQEIQTCCGRSAAVT